MILNDLWKRGVEQMKEELGEGFVEGYYKKSYDLQSRAGFYNEIAKIDASAVEDAVSYPWSGAMFSDRLWQSKQALVFNTREIITQGLIQGKSVGVLQKRRTPDPHRNRPYPRRSRQKGLQGSRRRGI